MYSIVGDIVKVNLSVAVPKAYRGSYSLGPTTNNNDEDITSLCKRVMLFDDTAKAVMATTPYRALCSTISTGGHLIPNTDTGIVEIPKKDWDERKDHMQQNPGKCLLSRSTFQIGGTTTQQEPRSFEAKFADTCWSPLLKGFMTSPDTLWIPASLAHLEPPAPCCCMCLETELELLRAELAWHKETCQRMLQCFGGLGGILDEDGTVELESGGKYYSPMYGASKPGSMVYLSKKESTSVEASSEPPEKKVKSGDDTAL